MAIFRNNSWRSISTCLLFLWISSCDSRRRRYQRNEVPPTEVDEYGCQCVWTQWMNNDNFKTSVGDDTTYKNLRRLYDFCQEPKKIKCRDKHNWSIPYQLLNLKNTKCDVKTGLTCVSTPWKGNGRNTHYCNDYEITVQCCHCPTTTATTQPVTTTTVSMTTDEFDSAVNNSAKAEYSAFDTNFDKPLTNETASENRTTSDEELPLTLILICVFGGIVIIAFMAMIWFILTKTQRKRPPRHHNYYEEAPLDDFSPVIPRDAESETKPKVAFNFTKESTSDFITSSSEDEGYRSRPTYNRKRKTKSQRDRKLNGIHGYPSDSFEFPTLGSLTPTDDNNSDDGRLRKWFPDEYERSLQQKSRQPVPKTRLLFVTPFSSNSKRSTPSYLDGES